jgi:hypothetical protein
MIQVLRLSLPSLSSCQPEGAGKASARLRERTLGQDASEKLD